MTIHLSILVQIARFPNPIFFKPRENLELVKKAWSDGHALR